LFYIYIFSLTLILLENEPQRWKFFYMSWSENKSSDINITMTVSNYKVSSCQEMLSKFFKWRQVNILYRDSDKVRSGQKAICRKNYPIPGLYFGKTRNKNNKYSLSESWKYYFTSVSLLHRNNQHVLCRTWWIIYFKKFVLVRKLSGKKEE